MAEKSERVETWDKVLFNPYNDEYYWADADPIDYLWDEYDKVHLPDYLVCCDTEPIVCKPDFESVILEYLNDNYRNQYGEYPSDYLEKPEKLKALCEQFSKDVNAYLAEHCKFYNYVKTNKIIWLKDYWEAKQAETNE